MPRALHRQGRCASHAVNWRLDARERDAVRRWFSWGAIGLALLAMSACVLVPGRHGRLRVGVALPVPVIRVHIPGPAHAPLPQHHGGHGPQHDGYPPPQPHAPAPYPGRVDPGYPTAGHAPDAMPFGTVRSVESVAGGYGRSAGMRLVVDLDSREVRAFDMPYGGRWRVGDRVRIDGNHVYGL